MVVICEASGVPETQLRHGKCNLQLQRQTSPRPISIYHDLPLRDLHVCIRLHGSACDDKHENVVALCRLSRGHRTGAIGVTFLDAMRTEARHLCHAYDYTSHCHAAEAGRRQGISSGVDSGASGRWV